MPTGFAGNSPPSPARDRASLWQGRSCLDPAATGHL